MFGVVVLLQNTFGFNKQAFIFLKAFFITVFHSTVYYACPTNS